MAKKEESSARWKRLPSGKVIYERIGQESENKFIKELREWIKRGNK